MPSEKNRQDLEELSAFLLETLSRTQPPLLPDAYASVDAVRELHASLLCLRNFLHAASNGNLAEDLPLEGFLGGTLKTLQANLRHLTWQTKRVAAGDFSQRVEFMGEFGESFNTMVMQFDRILTELSRKRTELSQANDALLQEITMRKRTEAALRKNERALRRMVVTDPLTGLFNRRHFNKMARDAIGKALRYARPLSVIIFDIDFFKLVNDNYGHTSGDLVLKSLARITEETLRDTDVPARFGGEEFIVLLYETAAAEAAEVAERLRQRFEETAIASDRGPIKVTASFGVSDCLQNIPGATRDAVLSEFVTTADRALYAAKNAGRNRVSVFAWEQSGLQAVEP